MKANSTAEASSPDTANVDWEEIRQFDQHGTEWWDPNGPLKTLHVINPTRLKFVRNFVSLDDQKLLDVGCGGGLFSEGAARAGADVTGADLSKPAIAAAIAHAPKELTLNYVESAAEQLVDAGERYNIVTCFELLEHVPSPETLIAQLSALVAPNGWLFLSTLNRTPKAFVTAIVGAEHVLRLLPRGTHRYDRFIKPSELSTWLRALDFDVVDIQGLSYRPWSETAALTNDTSVNYLLAARRL